MKRYVLALDLVDDAQRMAEYEAAHVRIWPQVREHLHATGVLNMEIYRLGTRMCMVMEVDEALYTPQAAAIAAAHNPVIQEWETLMWRYQQATPWTPAGEKWTEMKRIFDLSVQ